VKSSEARRLVAAMGLTEHVRALVDATPPLTADQVERVKRILTSAARQSRSGAGVIRRRAVPTRADERERAQR
jgi:hypothetical protein